MKGKSILLIIILIIGVINIASAGVYLGVVEGYVSYLNGTKTSSANIYITVNNCSDGCSNNGQTDSNGYYVIGNLNIPAGGSITVSAVKGIYHGSGDFVADEYGTAYANLSLHTTPGVPSLNVNVPDNHGDEVEIICTPGADNNGETPIVKVYIDGNYIGEGETFSKTVSTSYGSHEVTCNTCDSYECSNAASKTFSLINNPPTSPILKEISGVEGTFVNLEWTSGSDPDGDMTHDELNFNGSSYPLVKSPFSVLDLDLFKEYSWSVRTCDDKGACSDWISSSFVTYTCNKSITGGKTIIKPTCSSIRIWNTVPVMVVYPSVIKEGSYINISLSYNITNLKRYSIEVTPKTSGLTLVNNNSHVEENIYHKDYSFISNSAGPFKFEITLSDGGSTLHKTIVVKTVSTEIVETQRVIFTPFVNYILLIVAISSLLALIIVLVKRKREY